MRLEDVEFYLMENVRTPNGPGKLAGRKVDEFGQMRLIVRHAADLVKVEIPAEVPLIAKHGKKWVFFSYPPEMVEVVEP